MSDTGISVKVVDWLVKRELVTVTVKAENGAEAADIDTASGGRESRVRIELTEDGIATLVRFRLL